MRLHDFDVLTFDTYGTLIDWETGLMEALDALPARLDTRLGRNELLARFGRIETDQQSATPDMRYSDLLAVVYRRLADELGVAATEDEARRFGGSVVDWPAFPDATEALAYLKAHFTLITLTNCDQTSYRGSAARLGEPWHAIYTAEDVGSYKPDTANFDYLLAHVEADFGKPKSAILHVAQSLYHDHVPATAMGLSTVWIDRRHDTDGFGATAKPEGDYRLDFTFNSMAELANAHRDEG